MAVEILKNSLCLTKMNQAAMRRNPMMTSTSGIHSFLPSLPTLSTTSSPKSSLQAAAFLLFNDFRPGGVKPPIEALYCSNVIDIFGHQGHSKKVELLSQNCQSSFNNHWSQRLISCCNHYVFANTDLFTDLRKVVQIRAAIA